MTLPWWGFALALIFTALPVLAVASPASCDFFMHLSRAGIIANDSLPLFRDAYRYHLVPLPNLAVDVLIPALAKIMSIVMAGKAFTLLTLLLQATGAAALSFAVQRRLTVAALFIPLLCYNFILIWGFMGYLLGIGLSLWGLATFVMLRDQSVAIRALVLSLFAVTVYFCHLAAFGLLMLSAFLFEVIDFLQSGRTEWPRLWRSLGVIAIACVAPAYVHLRLSPVDESVGFTPPLPRNWTSDLNALLNIHRTPAMALLQLMAYVGIALLIAFKALRIDRRLGWLALACYLCYMAMPMELYGSMFASTRLLPFVGFLFLASLRAAPARETTRVMVTGFAVTLLAFQSTLILRMWRTWAGEQTEMLATAQQAAPGTMFIALEKWEPSEKSLPPWASTQEFLAHLFKNDPYWHPPTNHVTDEVTLKGEYLPIQLYLSPGKQPVEIDPKYLDIFLRVDSSTGEEIAPVTYARYEAMNEAQRRQVFRKLTCNPLSISDETRGAVRDLLVQCDQEYRDIRRASRVYPDAGTFVVYIHRFGPAPNPYPGLLHEVGSGRLYSVYEVSPSSRVAAQHFGRG